MSHPNPQLVGSVFERSTSSKSAFTDSKHAGSSRATGFPTAQHRSKSAFARGREELKKRTEAPVSVSTVPVVKSTTAAKSLAPETDTGTMLRQIDEQNARAVQAMTDEQREQERAEIVEQMGDGIGDLLKKAREARQRREQRLNDANPPMQIAAPSPKSGSLTSQASSPPSALSQPGTRPSSRADRRLRFADVKPNDVHVYESAPSSPKRKPFALLSPLDDPDTSSHTSLGTFSASTLPQSSSSLEKHPETGTPEDIRRRFFPNAPAFDPNLAWMDPAISSNVPAGPESTDLRFDLTGTPISPAMAAELPTHLGLHHHGDPALRAGYTLDDLFLLSRSTVPAQRSAMLDVLARLVHKLGKGLVAELKGREEELRKRVLAAGVEAMGERGNVGARAVEIIWECLVGWDDAVDVDGVELGSSGDGHAISSLPLDSFLDQIATSLAHGSLPRHSLTQLLAIMHRLAKHTNAIADSIIATPNLVPAVLRTYLLTPYPPTEDQALPDPAALHLLATLACASRANALALTDPADALLRFLTTLPSASAYPPALATALLGSTLTFYTALARYGLYAHIATIASTHFASLTAYILSAECSSKALTHAWVELVESWIICAIDPHATTPEHEILWTQVVGWDWAGDVSALKEKLQVEGDSQTLWAGVWRAQAAWLEGTRVNGERGGEEERAVAVQAFRGEFEDGNDKAVLMRALDGLQAAFRSPEIKADAMRDIAAHAGVVSAAIRLWLSTLPNATTAPPSPPYALPFSDLSQLAATLVAHPLWNIAISPSVQMHLRSLSGLLALYIRLSRVLPGISQDLWMAQALSVLCRLVPGDEEFGIQLLDDIINFITREFTVTRGLNAPSIVWERGGMDVIKPFMMHAVQPDSSVYIGLSNASPQSIKLATTQRVPRRRKPGSGHGLPLTSDWVLTPLDHLLRSATSPVLQALSSTWNASETEVVRASLLLAKVVKEVLGRFGLGAQGMGRAETVFGCMKVFMLEHDQPQGDDGDVEVFRDAVVERLMEELLAPFAAAAGDSARAPAQFGPGDDLENAAARFLGASTPFYQYYTDFVALYDSVSFSHQTFARLLLPPISMRYAPDYRKHLWSDFGHVLRSVKTPVEQVITQDVREYLWPVETDNLILASYLQALLKGPLEGFLRLVAVHHIAHNIWPDLGGGEDMERAKQFMRAIAERGDGPAVREVLRYRQDGRDDPLLVPPVCFAQDGEWKGGRKEFIGRCIGEDMGSRLAVVLDEAL